MLFPYRPLRMGGDGFIHHKHQHSAQTRRTIAVSDRQLPIFLRQQKYGNPLTPTFEEYDEEQDDFGAGEESRANGGSGSKCSQSRILMASLCWQAERGMDEATAGGCLISWISERLYM